MKSLRLIFFPRERHPSFRGRIQVLFGRELAGRGHRIEMVMQAEDASGPFGATPWPGGTLWVGRQRAGAGFLVRVLRLLSAFRHAAAHLLRVRAGQFDAIIISDQYLLAALALAVRTRNCVPVFFWLTFPYHELSLLRSRQPGERFRLVHALAGRITSWMLYRYIIPRVDHCFVQSPRMAQNLAAEAGHLQKMSSILTGIDMADFPPARPCEPPHPPFVVAYLGTLVRERQLVVLVEMLALLRQQGLDVRLLLVGDGGIPQDRAEIVDAAARLGVTDRLTITGLLPRDQALRVMGGAHVGISPFFPDRVQEVASPTKLIEYLALCLPVIANDHPEQRQVVNDSHAGLCVPWGAQHFARAVEWMMKRSVSEREAMARSGREWVGMHRTYSSIADGVEQTLLRTCAEFRAVSSGR